MIIKIFQLFLILNISVRLLETSKEPPCFQKEENDLSVEIETDYLENYEEKFSSDEELDIMMDDESNDYEESESYEFELDEEKLSVDAIKKYLKYCPHDCICEYNELHEYFVATCSRLDLETQSFSNLPITDLQVIDVGPQYPIRLGDKFFMKIGLENATSIKIANRSIEYISPSAFNGLNKLFSIDFASSGINQIHPDTFANNMNFKMLTLSHNDLKIIQSLSSSYNHYMLKSPSIEALDISNCNMQAFLPTAFNQMKNIVYINLAGNKLKTLPEGLFDKTVNIKELNLSYNEITTLPKNLFKTTSLKILHLKYNEIVSNLDFVTKDVEKLDVSYNKITSVNNQMFRTMENLSFLSLQGNKLITISIEAFITLNSLRHIDLSFNDLDQLSSLIFLKNSDLKFIRINDNIRLKTLPNDGFKTNSVNFAKVSYFDASNCNLSNLSQNTFKTMPFITRLVLNGNRIENIPKGLFSQLLLLVELDLSNNLITNLNPQIFCSNEELQELNLSSNPLKSLSPKVFESTLYLRKLDVSDCDLVTLWDESPKNRVFRFLEELNASNNDIKNIHAGDLSTMKNLKVFDLKNNPLECNDKFKNLIECMKFQNISLGDDLINRICDETNKLVIEIESTVGEVSYEEEKEAIKEAIDEDYKTHSFDL